MMFKVWLNSTEKHKTNKKKNWCYQPQAQQKTNGTIKDLERKEYGHSVAEEHSGRNRIYIFLRQPSEKHNSAFTLLGFIQEASNGTQNLLWTCSDLSSQTILEPLNVLPVLLTHKPQPFLLAVCGSYTAVLPISERRGSYQLS